MYVLLLEPMLGYMEKSIRVADGTQAANQLTLSKRDYSGLSGRPSVITRVLINGRGRQKRKSESEI